MTVTLLKRLNRKVGQTHLGARLMPAHVRYRSTLVPGAHITSIARTLYPIAIQDYVRSCYMKHLRL